MLEALTQGIVLGVILSFLIGPVFFLLIQTSMKEGMKSAMFLIAGIFLSDVFCILLAYFGISQIFEDFTVKLYIGMLGGSVMIITGLIALFKKPKIHLYDVSTYKKSAPILLFLKGLLLNTTNPFVFIFWLGTMAEAMPKFKGDSSKIFAYFSVAMITIFSFDLLKAWSSKQLSEKIQPQRFLVITRISGAAIIVFGIVLIYRVAST